ncbi:MAG: hypothetical protein ABI856_09045 [Nitrospira sp.]
MTASAFRRVSYEAQERQVSWQGIQLADGDIFNSFMTNEVSSRLYDNDGSNDFKVHLRSLATTGFAADSLDEILAAEVPEERDWAVGEAMAEAYLMHNHNVTWPWNMERDKRTPRASLPGADLVGFEINASSVRLVLGEVKTSGDASTPPNVMNGRSGMAHQIDNLANNFGLIFQLLKWLWPRCKRTQHEPSFNAAVTVFQNSGNKDIALFGVLIRDTAPNELDLLSRGQSLARTLYDPSTCQLIALYLRCAITDLPICVSGGRSS